MKNEKYAILRKDSPLFEIFSDGRIPMKRFPEGTREGKQEEEIEFYGLDLAVLGEKDIEQLLTLLKEMGIKADLRDLEQEGYKILEEHIIGVSYPGFRLF